MKKRRELKKYQKPKIIYEKEIEVLAGVCDSLWGEHGWICRLVFPTCNKVRF